MSVDRDQPSALARQVLVILGDGAETAAYLHEVLLPRNTWLNRQFAPFPGTTIEEVIAVLDELEGAGFVTEQPIRLPPPHPAQSFPEAVGPAWRLTTSGEAASWKAFADLGGPEALWVRPDCERVRLEGG